VQAEDVPHKPQHVVAWLSVKAHDYALVAQAAEYQLNEAISLVKRYAVQYRSCAKA
jgi:hypothetical protein